MMTNKQSVQVIKKNICQIYIVPFSKNKIIHADKSGLIMLIFQQKICHIGKVPWQIFGMEWSYRIMRLHVIFAQTQSDKRSFDGKDKLFPLEILVF
mmetsp:Transcript_7115/g.10475  ORF Transcript_7115/g.10475 Transcript_7115/m.10475 type:complete len:96 (+) Transcript_7115:552-839(+)